ncbi:hypothetical protein [Streptomyces sp. NPDC059970]|uniref:hypothetical protein n=1 Tax=Streptomyces sp. NPDC059970 TaxID=3347019 RepID=UPI003681CF6B
MQTPQRTKAHDVLVALYPAKRASVDRWLSSQLSAIPSGPGKQAGIRVGAEVARRLISLRSHDGSSTKPPPFSPRNVAGGYRPTPPDFPTPPRSAPSTARNAGPTPGASSTTTRCRPLTASPDYC